MRISRKWYNWTGRLEVATGLVGNTTDMVWTLVSDTVKYRAEDQQVTKHQWQRNERDDFTKLSLDVELDPDRKYRFFVEGADTSDPEQAKPIEIIRPVYDHRGRFVHTVVSF